MQVRKLSGSTSSQSMTRAGWSAALTMAVLAGLAAPALAQNTPAPAAPAPPAPAAAPAADPALRSDEAAQKLLREASETLKNLGSLSFKSKQSLEGMAKLSMSGEGEIKFLRNKAAPSASAIWIKGEIQLPMSPKVAYHSMFDGKNAAWIDTQNRTLNIQPAPVADSVRQVKNPKDRLVPPTYFELEPFGGELRADVVMSAGEEEIRGQRCNVIRAISTQRQRETKIWLGVNDKLPRRIEQISSHREGKASYVTEMWDLDTTSLSEADFAIALPEGYEKKTLDPAPPPKPMTLPGARPENPNAPKPVQVDDLTVPEPVRRAQLNAQRARDGLPPLGPNEPLPVPAVATPAPAATSPVPAAPATPAAPRPGLAAGSEAPPWSLKALDGGNDPITLASLRGKTVVLGFWGSLFGTSRGLLTNLEQIQTGLSGQNVVVLGIACRTPEAAARETFATNNITFPNLTAGDAVARDYKVRGYPTTVIITPEGKISTVIEGSANSQALQLAIQRAMKGEVDKGQ